LAIVKMHSDVNVQLLIKSCIRKKRGIVEKNTISLMSWEIWHTKTRDTLSPLLYNYCLLSTIHHQMPRETRNENKWSIYWWQFLQWEYKYWKA